ncbi:hypothetical protein BRAS3809_1650001 [Bradyrhizobium sp. STM 3809]|nr:hypothetical protein BRAS3809_1650001 [Bradyrhizobium sp. STM 3809]
MKKTIRRQTKPPRDVPSHLIDMKVVELGDWRARRWRVSVDSSSRPILTSSKNGNGAACRSGRMPAGYWLFRNS